MTFFSVIGRFANFTDADLSRVALDVADLRSANFTRTNLTHATGRSSDFLGATFFDTICPNGTTGNSPIACGF